MTDVIADRAVPAQQSAPGVQPPRPARQWELDALRVIAIAGVVAIHIFGMMVINDGLHGTRRWWVAVGMQLGATWVVPVFVMISGALVLAPRAHAAGPGAFYRRRFVRILPAFVVWHLVYLFVVRLGLRGQGFHLRGEVVALIDAKTYTALYFLWLIAGLYVIAPVLATFLHAGGRRRALITAAIALGWTQIAYAISAFAGAIGAPRPITLGAWTQWWPYVGYFVAGWALHRVVLGRRGMVVAALVAVAGIAEVVWQFGAEPGVRILDVFAPQTRLGPIVAATAIAVFLVAVGIGARWAPGPRTAAVLKRLSDATFGVFLVHLLLFVILQQTVPAVYAASSLWVLLGAYAGVLMASFAIAVGASRVPYLRAIF